MKYRIELTEEQMNDLISRQAAIDALKRDEEYDEDIPNRADGVRDAIITIMGLPSVQPEIIRCKDCVLRATDECPMYHVEWVSYEDDGYTEIDDKVYDWTEDDGFCHLGKEKVNHED
jgi:hypothetical protein